MLGCDSLSAAKAAHKTNLFFLVTKIGDFESSAQMGSSRTSQVA